MGKAEEAKIPSLPSLVCERDTSESTFRPIGHLDDRLPRKLPKQNAHKSAEYIYHVRIWEID